MSAGTRYDLEQVTNATQAADLVRRYLAQGEWDLAHQVITDFRRSTTAGDEDQDKFADLDPTVMRVLIHLEHAVRLPPSEAAPEWQRAYQAITECRQHFESEDAPPNPADVWEISLAQLGIETRLVNVLERELIATVGDVLFESHGRLLAVRSFSAKLCDRLAAAIYALRDQIHDEANRTRFESHVDYDWKFYLKHQTWPIHSA